MFVPFTGEQLNEAAASASWMAPDAEPDTLAAIGKALYDSVEALLYQELRKNRNSVDEAKVEQIPPCGRQAMWSKIFEKETTS